MTPVFWQKKNEELPGYLDKEPVEDLCKADETETKEQAKNPANIGDEGKHWIPCTSLVFWIHDSQIL